MMDDLEPTGGLSFLVNYKPAKFIAVLPGSRAPEVLTLGLLVNFVDKWFLHSVILHLVITRRLKGTRILYVNKYVFHVVEASSKDTQSSCFGL